MNAPRMNDRKKLSARAAYSGNKESNNPTKHSVGRSVSLSADSLETRCHAVTAFHLHTPSGHVYLHRRGNFQHQNHPSECPADTSCNKGNLGGEEFNLLKVLYKQGVSSKSCANIFNQMRHKCDKRGVFTPNN